MAENKAQIVISARDDTSAALSSITTRLGGLGQAAAAIGPQIAAAFSVTAIAGFAKSAIDAGDALNDLRQKTGVSVAALASYKLAAEQSGTSIDTVAKGMKNLSVELVKNGASLKAAGITATTADGAMRQLADLFAAMPDGVEKTTLAAELLGSKLDGELIPLLNLGSAGLDASAAAAQRYGAAMTILAPQADLFNDQLAEIKLNLEAGGAEMAGKVIPLLNVLAAEFNDATKEATAFSLAGEGVKVVFETIAVLGVNVAYVLEQTGREIGGIAAQLAALASGDFKGFQFIGDEMKADAARARQEIDALSERILNAKAATQEAAASGGTDKFREQWEKLLQGLTKTPAAAGAAKKSVDELQQLLGKIFAKDSGLDAGYWKDLETLHKGFVSGRVTLAEYQAAVGSLTAQQKFATDIVAAEKKAEEEFQRAAEKSREEISRQLESLEEKATAAEAELENYGKTKSEIEATTIARLEEQRTIAAGFGEMDALVADLDREIAARQRIRAAMEGVESADVAKKAAEESAKAWEKFADDIERSLTDSLFRAFESGEDFGKAFAKSLENTFKTMVLKFAVQATVSAGGNLVNSGINAVLGTSGSNDGAGVDYFGLANKASTANSLFNAGSFAGNAIFGSGSGTVASWLAGTSAVSPASVAAANLSGAMGGDALGSLIAAEGWSASAATAAGVEAGAAAAVAGAEAGASAAATAASTSWIPVVGWVAAAGALIYSFKDKIFGGDWEATGAPRMVGGFSAADAGFVSGYTLQDYEKDGGWFGKDGKKTESTAISSEFDRLLDRMYTGVRDSYIAVGKLFDDTDLADKLVGFAQRIEIADATNLQAAFETMAKNLADAMGRTLFPSIAALTAAGEDFAATFQRVVGEAEAVNKAFAILGTTLGEQFGKNNADKVLRLSDSLVTLFGGIDQMLNGVQAYYAGYYSQPEQRDIMGEALQQQFEALGVAMPETRTQFRRLVESMDLTSASGQQAYATLINMSEAFGTWADSLGETTDAMTRQIEDALGGLFDGLLQQIAGARDGLAGAMATVGGGVGLMTPAQIRAGIAGASLSLPNGSNIVATQAALAKAQTDSASAISAAVALRDAEQAAVNQRNQGWAVRVGGTQVGGWALNGGEQVNEFNTIVQQAAAAGVLASSELFYSSYRDSAAAFSLADGYQFFLDGSPIGQSLALNHSQDYVSANGAGWGRYNRDLGIYAYKPYGSEQLNPWYDQNVASAKATGAANITAAEQAAVQAQIDYTKAIQQYVIDAGKAVEKLNSLRDETVKYYEAQQQLANTLLTSAGNLREAVRLARQAQLSEADLLAQRRLEFNRYYSLGLATAGATQAGYADKMAGLLPTLIASLENTVGSSADWARASASLYAQSNTIAGMLETQAAVDYQTEALGLLGAIDTTLALIEANASSAEKLITDAIYATGNTNAAGLRAVIAAITGKPIPAFAMGGSFAGGWRLVGERGPELEATGPARIFNAGQTQAILAGANQEALITELRALRAENAELRSEMRAVASHTHKTARQLEQVIGDGVIVRTENGFPLETIAA